MSHSFKNIHLPGMDLVSRSISALKGSVGQMKDSFDDGVTDTINIVTDIYDDAGTTKSHYREVTIENGLITNIGDEKIGG